MKRLAFIGVGIATFAAACSSNNVDIGNELVGSAQAQITHVPNGVGCVRISAAGAVTVTRDFAVSPGQNSVLALAKLPTGTVTFAGSAFNVACNAVTDPSTASWVADPVTTTVSPVTPGTVTLAFHLSGSETVNADFDDGSDGGVICAPKTCAALGFNCGNASDGCGGTINCGTCSGAQTCGGGGTANVCGACVPKTCAAQGFNCGNASDGCGGTINCGTCSLFQVCGGGGGAPNVCH